MSGHNNALPVNFDTFGEARQAGFMRAKAIKDAGGRIAGTFCTYTPNEIFDAAGIYTVSLCGTSDETIPDAERDLPKNLCPLIKSSYGFAVSDKCPYTYFSDIIIGETTCDGKKKMYEMLGELKDVFILQLPQRQDLPGMLDMWTAELRRLIKTLEEKFDIEITDEALRNAVRAIARRYLDIGCAVMSPNPNRLEEIRSLASEYKIDGVVDIVLQFCQPYSIETRQIARVSRELGLPYIAIETDYSGTDRGQLETRLTAFLEMME